MKKYTIYLCMLIVFAFISIIYYNRNKKADIAGSDWKMESIADLNGTMPAIIPEENPSEQSYNMNLHFDKDSFELSDLTNNHVWKGSYTSEMTDKKHSTYKLNLSFNDTNTLVLGVLGTRTYQNKTKVRSITLVTKNKILSFIVRK